MMIVPVREYAAAHDDEALKAADADTVLDEIRQEADEGLGYSE